MPFLLFIDDLTCGSRALIDTLRSVGYTVAVVSDRQEAIDLFQFGAVDAVLMDCHVEINGAPLASVLRQLNPNTPIVMYSGLCRPPCTAMSTADACVQKGSTAAILETLRMTLCA